MSWAGARTQIKTALEALAITSPTALSVKRCYEFPPATIQDYPAFIIYPPSLDVQVGPSSRVRTYRPKLRMIVSDQDMSQSAAIADAFREVLVTAFDDKVDLTGTVTLCWIERCDELAGFEIPVGKMWIGFDSFLHLEIKETVNFS